MTSQPAVSLGVAAVVVEEGTGPAVAFVLNGYDVAPDGRILVARSDTSTTESQPRLVLVQNRLRAIRE